MRHIGTILTRGIAASAIAGAAALGTAQATQWGKLEPHDWPGTQQPQRQSAFVAQISDAFQQLGMSGPRASCYGRVLQQKLKTRHRPVAVEILRTSTQPGQVRRKVMAEGFDIMGGFRAANRRCPESMGS